MKEDNVLQVYYEEKRVGILALTADHKAAFQYDEKWLENGFSISPFSLPLKKQVFLPTKDYFSGLFGVFADSLPDNWGRLLLDRLIRAHKQAPDELTVLDRLAIVGKSGMGALTYYPEKSFSEQTGNLDLDELAEECQKILNTEYSDKLDELYRLGGTSGGTRPKIMTTINGEEWIIKFPAHVDGKDTGKMEYDYSCCARQCGIAMSKARLFPSDKCEGYFGTKRFDRRGKGEEGKVHMVSAAGLLETSHRIPNLDYDILMKLTLQLTKSMEECEKLYRLMCFNVFAHNRDDHSKNFSYIYRDEEKRWILSPAYDLTYSNSIGGEHATTVNGNGADPGMDDLLSVAKKIGLGMTKARKTAAEIQECVQERLRDYLSDRIE